MAQNVDKMYTYLRGLLVGANMKESIQALQFAREHHKDQTRKDGTPYIVHPLSMACYAVALGIRDDITIAVILLHDVCEDCGIPISMLPFSTEIVSGVKYMTIQKFDTDKSKIEGKRRYFNELLESRHAIICKGIDRYFNLRDMPFALTPDAIGKNIAETEILLLPTLKRAKEKWADMSDIMYILRTNIRGLTDILKLQAKEDYDKWYKEYTEK